MEFYIPLSSADAVHQQHPSSCQIFLPKRISLQGEYEVALLETSYPSELHTVVSEIDSKIIIKFNSSEGSTITRVIHIPRKCYISVDDFIETINEYVSDVTDKITVEKGPDGLVIVKSLECEIVFSELIRDILGLKSNTVCHSACYSQSLTNINQQHNFLNICTDIITP